MRHQKHDNPGSRFPHNEYECTRCGRVEDISSSNDTVQLNCETCGESTKWGKL